MRNEPESKAGRRAEAAGGVDSRADYVARVNRALDHVLDHLAEPLPLEVVARAAGFSPFHFHRVFKARMGETLREFVGRQRLERALTLMSRRPTRSLTEIALECGFASSSDFSRAFRQRYGVAPSRFDLAAWRARHREELVGTVEPARLRPALAPLAPGANPDGFEVVLRRLPARTVAYLRVLDPFRSGGVVPAARELVAWAEARGLADGRWYGTMWEDPEVVALEHCRYDVAVEVEDVVPDGRVGRHVFPPMLVAELALRGDIALELRALDWLFTTWLPRSGFEPDEQPCFEAWAGRPFAHGTKHFELAVQLPVR